jgi:hypothetical protein
MYGPGNGGQGDGRRGVNDVRLGISYKGPLKGDLAGIVSNRINFTDVNF